MQDKTRTALIEKIIDRDTDPAALNRALKALNDVNVGMEEKRQCFMSDKDAREFAGGISRGTLWSWRKAGLKFYGIGGRILYKAEDISNYIIGGNGK